MRVWVGGLRPGCRGPSSLCHGVPSPRRTSHHWPGVTTPLEAGVLNDQETDDVIVRRRVKSMPSSRARPVRLRRESENLCRKCRKCHIDIFVKYAPCLRLRVRWSLRGAFSNVGTPVGTPTKKNPHPTCVEKGLLRCQAESNRCTRFCRPVPNRSAIAPMGLQR